MDSGGGALDSGRVTLDSEGRTLESGGVTLGSGASSGSATGAGVKQPNVEEWWGEHFCPAGMDPEAAGTGAAGGAGAGLVNPKTCRRVLMGAAAAAPGGWEQETRGSSCCRTTTATGEKELHCHQDTHNKPHASIMKKQDQTKQNIFKLENLQLDHLKLSPERGEVM